MLIPGAIKVIGLAYPEAVFRFNREEERKGVLCRHRQGLRRLDACKGVLQVEMDGVRTKRGDFHLNRVAGANGVQRADNHLGQRKHVHVNTVLDGRRAAGVQLFHHEPPFRQSVRRIVPDLFADGGEIRRTMPYAAAGTVDGERHQRDGVPNA